MTTTTPSQDRAQAGVSVGQVPAPRPSPHRDAAVAIAPRPAPVAPTPTEAAVPVVVPQPRTATATAGTTTPVLPEPTVARPSRVWPVGTGSARVARVRRQWSVPVSELMALLTIGVVATVGAVSVLVTLSVPAEEAAAAPPPSVSPNVSVPGRVLTAVDDGVWQVGVDIEPGTYASTGSVAGATCRHALRLARTGGDVGTTTVPTGPTAVVLTADDGWFATSGCATWTRVS
jgi:hypothetical protein